MTGYDLSLYIVKERKSTLIGTGTEVQELYTYLKKRYPGLVTLHQYPPMSIV